MKFNPTTGKLETSPPPGGSGDMVLANAQTNTGVKTFLDATLGLRNVANSITSFFTNAATVARTWTFPNKDGTVAMTSDITGTNSGTNTGDNATNSQYSGLVTNATHTGEVTGSGALTIASNAVTNAKMATMVTKTYKGNTAAGTAAPTDVSVATLKTDLGLNNVDNTSNATERAAAATLTNKTFTDAKMVGALNAQTGTTYTLALTDASKTVTMSNVAANTLTVPPNSSVAFPVGTRLLVTQIAAGSTTIAAGVGVTINAPASAPLAIGEIYGSRGLEKRATDTWQLI